MLLAGLQFGAGHFIFRVQGTLSLTVGIAMHAAGQDIS